MSIKSKKIHPDIHFRLLDSIEGQSDLTQRALAKKLGISLGGVNYCLRELIRIGHIKIINFENSNRKLSYLYMLTPSGIKEKTILTSKFLKRKMIEYYNLKKEIELIQSKINHD